MSDWTIFADVVLPVVAVVGMLALKRSTRVSDPDKGAVALAVIVGGFLIWVTS